MPPAGQKVLEEVNSITLVRLPLITELIYNSGPELLYGWALVLVF
jgi:hypothetical protein